MVNPAHDAGDVVRITRSRSKIDRYFILDQMTIPMEPTGVLEAATREARAY